MRLQIGAPAPILELAGCVDRSPWETERGRPWVLAYLPSWEPPEDLSLLRAQLEGLGASLVVLSRAGLWWFRGDRELDLVPSYPELAGDLERCARSYGVSPGREAIVVIDGEGVVRYAGESEQPLAMTLSYALASAAHALNAPSPRLDRRDLVATSLASSFSLLLLGTDDSSIARVG